LFERPSLSKEIRHGEGKLENLFPVKAIYEFDFNRDRVGRCVEKVGKHYEYLSKNKLFHGDWGYEFFQVLSEASTNTFYHGDAKEDELLTYEFYHASPERAILKISNLSAKEWDYQNLVDKYLQYKSKKSLGEPVKKPRVRCGFSTFSSTVFPISYADGGRTFLALLKA
jgi:hypothetical protein